jgi:hypothetical protein
VCEIGVPSTVRLNVAVHPLDVKRNPLLVTVPAFVILHFDKPLDFLHGFPLPSVFEYLTPELFDVTTKLSHVLFTTEAVMAGSQYVEIQGLNVLQGINPVFDVGIGKVSERKPVRCNKVHGKQDPFCREKHNNGIV